MTDISEGSTNAFDKLHPKVRETLHKMGWKKLKPIQVRAIHHILDGDDDLVISAATAGGKTEAAFLPIISKLSEAFDPGVQALYVGPLKALINDQFRRVENLCALVDIPVHRWHGDVGQGPKANLLEKPSGILLITPESIESLFINHATKLAYLFGGLQFIVVDEMHAFFGSERGAHLRSLMARLGSIGKAKPRRIGLSATLGDPNLACDWLRGQPDREVGLILGQANEREIKLKVHGYLTGPVEPETKAEAGLEGDLIDTPLEVAIFDHFRGKTALIFGNSKSKLEKCADFARRQCERLKIPNNFRIHHGSLSRVEREETEAALKSGRPTATFCSSTLEMGIDVGEVEIVGQISAPFSVNSLVQRTGRSGRRPGAASVLRMFLEEETLANDALLTRRIFPKFLRGVATVELMVANWLEPPDIHLLHLSTLVQQILSIIKERGGVLATDAYHSLVEAGAFALIDQPTFIQVLRDLGTADLIEQADGGLFDFGS